MKINKQLKKILKKTFLYNVYLHFFRKFPGSKNYWEKRYKKGGNSGVGSYNKQAEFKATGINKFVLEKNINSVIEFGCGDGNQLSFTVYKKYIGLDVSVSAVQRCINKFETDQTKSFYLYDTLSFKDNHSLFTAELALSLDVIYHLIEDNIFHLYMHHLFQSSSKFVIIYANDKDSKTKYHVRERKFSNWIKKHENNWKLIREIKDDNFWNSFYIYENKHV